MLSVNVEIKMTGGTSIILKLNNGTSPVCHYSDQLLFDIDHRCKICLTSPSVTFGPSLSLWDSVGVSSFCDGSLLVSSIAGVLLALSF